MLVSYVYEGMYLHFLKGREIFTVHLMQVAQFHLL